MNLRPYQQDIINECIVCRCKKPLSEFYFRKDNNKYRNECKKCCHIRSNKWKKKNIKALKKYKHGWYSKNKEKIRIQSNINKRGRKKKDDNYRIKENTHKKIWDILKNNYGSYKIEDVIGCSKEYLRQHMKKFIKNNVNLVDYSVYYQIDHIIPASLYKCACKNELKKCFNYRNLRLIAKEDNDSKRNKLIPALIKQYDIYDLLPEGVIIES